VGADGPTVHRNHERPAPDDAAGLLDLFAELGVAGDALREGVLAPRDVARALARLEGHPAAPFANLAALRAMKQARYGAESQGHFALAFERYLHFTSPIRRYADLAVHRVLTDVLAGEAVALTRDQAARVAARTSFRERVARDAEREMVDLKKCGFLQQHVGAALEGDVTGVARHGLYLTLERWPIEGLVHVSTLPEYVVLDERGHALVAEGSGARYGLGDRLRVRVAAVDPIRAQIDFELLEILERAPARKSARRTPR
jgi:ribonuclease R